MDLKENVAIAEDTVQLPSGDAFFIKSQKLLSVVTSIFILSILGIFPIIYRNYYFDILKFKYYYYVVNVIIMAVLIIFILIAIKIKRRNERSTVCSKRDIIDILPFVALFAFLCSAGISTIFSDYVFEAFWGNEGRYSGFFLLLIYGLAFLIISNIYSFKRWHLDVFLIASIVVCALGILDFVGIDLLHFKDHLEPSQRDMFTSTIGNINTYTAYLSLAVGMSCILFTTAKSWFSIVWYFFSMLITFIALIMGRSDNAYLSLMALFGLSPLYLVMNKGGIQRYLVMLSSFFSSILIVDFICRGFPEQVPKMEGLFGILVNIRGLPYLVIMLWIITGISYISKKELSNKARKRMRYIWSGIIIAAICIAGIMLYDANILGNGQRYGLLKGYLEFNDDWGTERGYAWRMAIQYYKEFPIIKKLFGYGPDTFGILTVTQNFDDMTRKYRMVFDSAHNEYLQYLITIGCFGLVSYITFLIASGIRMITYAGKQPAIMAILFAVLCYTLQAMVNISVPISAPVMWTLLMMGIAGSRSSSG